MINHYILFPIIYRTSQRTYPIKRVFSTEASDGELPAEPDSDESEDDSELTNVDPKITTSDLVDRAGRAGNIRNNQATPVTISNTVTIDDPPQSRKRKAQKSVSEVSQTTKNPKRKLKNSDIFPSSVRPDWLKEDKMINSLPRATVANVIAQSQMMDAINRQNKLKEDKADKSKGGLR